MGWQVVRRRRAPPEQFFQRRRSGPVVDGGSRVVVADSNRFDAAGAPAALTVVSSDAALAHRPSIVGTIRAQQGPRDVALEPAGTVLLVSNFGPGTLGAVHVGDHAQESHA